MVVPAAAKATVPSGVSLRPLRRFSMPTGGPRTKPSGTNRTIKPTSSPPADATKALKSCKIEQCPLFKTKHPQGRVHALERLTIKYLGQPGSVGHVIMHALRPFVSSLGPLRNILSGDIGRHYDQDLPKLLKKGASDYTLAATAFFETNHWNHTEHGPSRWAGRKLDEKDRFAVLAAAFDAVKRGEAPTLLGMGLNSLTPKQEEAFKKVAEIYSRIPAEGIEADGKYNQKALDFVLKELEALES